MIFSRILAYRYMGWRKRDLAGIGVAAMIGTVIGLAHVVNNWRWAPGDDE